MTAILLTALAIVIGGALTFSLGQIGVRGAVEPALELKRLIGRTAFDLDFQANRFHPNTPDEQHWRDLFGNHSCALREKLNLIVWYGLFAWILHLPSRRAVSTAALELLAHSNREAPPIRGLGLGERESEIKRLLRIKN